MYSQAKQLLQCTLMFNHLGQNIKVEKKNQVHRPKCFRSYSKPLLENYDSGKLHFNYPKILVQTP